MSGAAARSCRADWRSSRLPEQDFYSRLLQGSNGAWAGRGWTPLVWPGSGCHKVWQRGDAVARHNIFARPKVVDVEMRKGFFSLSARASLLGWIAKVPL